MDGLTKVTTETGRVYLIDQEKGFWMRMSKSGSSGSWIKTWSLQKGDQFGWPWNLPEGAWEEGFPEVGKFMFISGKDEWYVSTKVVSVEEV